MWMKSLSARSAFAAFSLRSAVAAVCFLALATGAQAQRPGQSIEVGRWNIAHLTNARGESVGCFASTSYDGGGVFGMMSDGSFTALLVAEPRLRLAPNSQHDVAFSYEGGRWTRASGEASADGSLTIAIPGPVDATLSTFADMDDMEVQLPNNITRALSLSGSGAAITAMRRCMQNRPSR